MLSLSESGQIFLPSLFGTSLRVVVGNAVSTSSAPLSLERISPDSGVNKINKKRAEVFRFRASIPAQPIGLRILALPLVFNEECHVLNPRVI
jgi:hypothetical protein